ncbi:MAG: hypothetical protein Q9166_002381 [cf. Caloplaca sp. 2 TL-2023]
MDGENLWAIFYGLVAGWYNLQEKLELAIDNCKKKFNLDPSDDETIFAICRFMHRQGQLRNITDFLKELQDQTMPEMGLQDWDFYLWSVTTARGTGEFTFVKEIMMALLNAAAKALRTVSAGNLLHTLGLTSIREFHDEDDAFDAWGNALNLECNFDQRTQYGFIRIAVSRKLPMRYFERALESQKNATERNSYIQKLEGITKREAFWPIDDPRQKGYLYHATGDTTYSGIRQAL